MDPMEGGPSTEAEEFIHKLRGPKVECYRMEGETKLLEPSKYPFNKDVLPVLCNAIDVKTEPLSAYISGYRSLVFPSNGNWFKAKAIGIPFGNSRPILKEGNLFTFFLTNANLGSGRLVWGFSKVEEAQNEISWMKKAKELDLRTTEPIGIGIYRNVFVINVKDRKELFSLLNRTSFDDLLRKFLKESRRVECACVFCMEPTDIRVDEVLYAFSFPGIEKILGKKDCKDYLKWLGSSCGYNLRLHHDNGIMHGTIRAGPGFMTNSHVANHLVREDGTWMTDYHMAGKAKDEVVKRVEVFCLCHVMNPLPHAEVIARSRFAREDYPNFEFYELLLSPSYEAMASLGEIGMGMPRAELTEAFIDGVQLGYYRRRIYEIDSGLKKEMLKKSILIKEKVWNILKLPKRMQRGIEYFHRALRFRKITEEVYSELAKIVNK